MCLNCIPARTAPHRTMRQEGGGQAREPHGALDESAVVAWGPSVGELKGTRFCTWTEAREKMPLR